MSTMVSQITSVSMVYSTLCSGADQRKHQSSVSLAFVRGIHRWPVNSPHKGPVMEKMFPFGDVIMDAIQKPRLNKWWETSQVDIIKSCFNELKWHQTGIWEKAHLDGLVQCCGISSALTYDTSILKKYVEYNVVFVISIIAYTVKFIR